MALRRILFTQFIMLLLLRLYIIYYVCNMHKGDTRALSFCFLLAREISLCARLFLL